MEPTKVKEKCGSIIRDINSPAVLQDEAFCEPGQNRDAQKKTKKRLGHAGPNDSAS